MESRHLIHEPLHFYTKDPGKQATGSFHPLDPMNYCYPAYTAHAHAHWLRSFALFRFWGGLVFFFFFFFFFYLLL